jgi:hypothetical protein
MRFILRCATIIGLSVVVFLGMQALFDGSNCIDCGAKIGFPFSYVQDGTYGTHGYMLWMGLLGDFAIALSVSTFAVGVWHIKIQSSPLQDVAPYVLTLPFRL